MSALAVSARSRATLVEGGEFRLTLEDFRSIATIMHADAGISLPENKATLVYSRLAKRLRALGLPDFSAYCKLVSGPDGANERHEMLAALTTNVTRFFREPHHFDHLKTIILPPLIKQARQGGRVRIWSSACSSGQEPYSIGLTILSLMPDAAKYDIKVLATDIDPNMVAAAKAGLYDKEALTPIPADMRQRWFEPAQNGSGRSRAHNDLRALIECRKLNLIGDWPMRGKFQAIFCRNVVIYFDLPTQEKIWTRMVPLLELEGALYLGHSERVSGPAERALRSDGITTYRRFTPNCALA
ncbi:CheR family methyltransferase [Acidiphilium sp.]|uniref:CheR family methyltransferase n=1 Tax=Acidiphilium sp. TaxID=527 RepID=UPI003D084CB3